MGDLKVMSLNCRGIHTKHKRLGVLKHLKDLNYNVYCIQETHFTPEQYKTIYTEWGSEVFLSYGSSHSRGVAIMFNKIDFKVHEILTDIDGNYVILDLTISDQRMTLASIYGPNTDCPSFYHRLFNIIDRIGNASYMICGDFNLVIDPDMDYFNYKHVNNKKARETLLEIIETRQLIDPFREFFPDKKLFTWRKQRPLQQARLDFFLLSPPLAIYTSKSSIEHSYQSDHSIIQSSFTFSEFQHSSGLWKHNNSLLKDKTYVDLLNTKIEDVIKQYALPVYNIDNISNIPREDIQFTISDQLFLDTLLMEIRGKSISYGSFKKKQSKTLEEELQSKMKDMEQNMTEENTDEYIILSNQLKQLQEDKLQAYIIRSKVKWSLEGEKPTQYFCGLEKSNIATKTISKIIKENGSEITSQDKILEEVRLFYETLYKEKVSESTIDEFDHYFQNTDIPKLSNSNAKSIDGIINLKEATDVLKNMKNNRSPGTSGFGADFYKIFWNRIGHFVVRALNEAYEFDSLSSTQTQGLITCIPKGNKPRHYLKNWRPITLLNTVYKIGTGCIANRIKTLLPQIIHTDQTGFLKGRYIGENTRLIYDIMHYTEENNIPGMLLLIDFEKAFDSLSWNFVTKTLQTFNFGHSIQKWFNVFYKDAKSAVTQCGFLSDFFKVQRGCRQGDPLSCYIFILCAEILSIKIRANKNIKGIEINETQYKLSQFADDTSFILDGSSKSLNETLNSLSEFSRYSGLNVNFDKTKVVWIGKKKFSADTIKTKWKLIWNQQHFQMLGINFHVDLSKMNDLNFSTKILEIEKAIKNWNRRILTPIGKIAVIKSLLVAKLNHLFLALPNPTEQMLNKLNSIFFEFIWNGRDKIKRSVIVKDYADGGLKMLNLFAFIRALKTTWIKKLILKDGGWSAIIKLEFDVDKLTSVGQVYVESIYKKCNNNFWADTFKAFSDLISSQKIKKDMFKEYPLFYDKHILIGEKSVYLQSWFKAGVRCVGDILDHNNCFMSLCDFNKTYKLNTNHLTHRGIIMAVEKALKSLHIKKKYLKESQRPFIPPYFRVLFQSEKGSKQMYNCLNASENEPSCKRMWCTKIPECNNFTNKEWKTIFSLPFAITKDSYVQWFQVRILHRILGTNSYLQKINYKEKPECTFCKTDPETIEHLFWHCPYSKTLIIDFLAFPNSPFYPIELSTVLFGYLNLNDIAKNTIVLFTKMFIFYCKTNLCKPTLQGLRKYIKFKFDIAQKVSLLENTAEDFNLIWGDLINLLIH